jgi:hypothetical protein
MSVLVSGLIFLKQHQGVWLTSAEEEVLDRLGLGDLVLVESQDMELRDVVHMDGNANLWRRSWVGASGQEAEEDGIGAVDKLLWCVCMDVTPENVPWNRVSVLFNLFDWYQSVEERHHTTTYEG